MQKKHTMVVDNEPILMYECTGLSGRVSPEYSFTQPFNTVSAPSRDAFVHSSYEGYVDIQGFSGTDKGSL